MQDSLVMEPPFTTQALWQNNLNILKQGHNTLDAYVGKGEEVLSRFPKRQEAEIVWAFVSGLTNPREKGAVEQQLDKYGWTWKEVTVVIQKLKAEDDKTRQRKGSRRRCKKRFIELPPLDDMNVA